MTWRAEDWRGTVTRVEYCRAPISIEDREAGLGVRDVHPDPLAWLREARLGMYHRDPVHDMASRMWPADDGKTWGSPVTEKQAAFVASIAHRYRKQVPVWAQNKTREGATA